MKNAFEFGKRTDGGSAVKNRNAPNKSAVLIVGSGRSGTSLMATSLKGLGGHIPQPEVPADDTNPSGFGESQWLVDFHSPILRRHGVLLSDARPEAVQLMSEPAFSDEERGRASEWVAEALTESQTIILKDPRITWFINEWRAVLDDLGCGVSTVHMVRHPLDVVASKYRWYNSGRTRTSDYLLGSWINTVRLVDSSSVADTTIPVLHRDLISNPKETVQHVVDNLLPGFGARNFPQDGNFLDDIFAPDRAHSFPGLFQNDDPVNPDLATIAEEIFASFVKESKGKLSSSKARISRQRAIAKYDEMYSNSMRLVHESQEFSTRSVTKLTTENKKWRSEHDKAVSQLRRAEQSLAQAYAHPLRFVVMMLLRRAKRLLGRMVRVVSPPLYKRLKSTIPN